MLRFGGPIFKDTGDDIEALVQAHKDKGYTAAYAPNASLDQPDRIREIRRAFEKAGIMIAEVGYWDNLVDTDDATRKRNRQIMLDALALAEELGARCAVDIFGSYVHGPGEVHAARNFAQEAFDEAVEMARYFIDEVKPRTAHFCYEIFPFNLVDSPEMIHKLIEAVDRPRFGVHMDLVNLINGPRAYWRSGDIIRECVRLFGDRIVSAHAKDIKMRGPSVSVILEEVHARRRQPGHRRKPARAPHAPA